MNIYESQQLIAQYLEFHYGSRYFDVPNYPVKCIETIMPHLNQDQHHNALDLGCAVGRSSFELGRFFDHVDGVDFSAAFIEQAIAIQSGAIQSYDITTEGVITESRRFSLNDLGYTDFSHINFHQGDACHLADDFTGYDLIFAGNLIDRLYQPARFLEDIGSRLQPKGLLALSSPYTWLDEFTDRENWLGGFYQNNDLQHPVSTLDAIKTRLSPHFDLLEVVDVPFVIRETARKYQHTVAQLSIWRKHIDQS